MGKMEAGMARIAQHMRRNEEHVNPGTDLSGEDQDQGFSQCGSHHDRAPTTGKSAVASFRFLFFTNR